MTQDRAESCSNTERILRRRSRDVRVLDCGRLPDQFRALAEKH